MTLTGRQRLQNIETKVRIIAARELRQFLSGEIDILPCSGDRLRDEIAREFDRLDAQLSARQGAGDDLTLRLSK